MDKVKENISHPATAFVKNIFSEVPKTYETVNPVLTFGYDIL